MQDYILISTLNDFIFCPYSIYLHNVYMGGDESLVHASPQAQGKAAHEAVDCQKYSSRKEDLSGISVYSNELGIMGKIDIYKGREKMLIERKFELHQIYQGQIYQLWAQYFCMTEMGYTVEKLAFHSIRDNQSTGIDVPTTEDKQKLMRFILSFKSYNPSEPIKTNPNKCMHCIYCNLCDKTDVENVYS